MSLASIDQSAAIINGRYRLLDRIGAGGMGEVFRAADLLSVGGAPVAIKRLTADAESLRFAAFDPKTMSGSSGETRLGLAREFQTLAALRHPNIIGVRDYGFDRGAPYLVMDLLENARPFSAAGAPLSLAGKIDLLVQLLSALAYLHRRGILHRDLKPENVLVVDGTVNVLDFGLAISQDAGHDPDRLAGTLPYMAPEILMGAPPSVATDLYAVGVMIYELFTEQFPFHGSNYVQSVLKQPPDMLPLMDKLGEDGLALNDVVWRLLAKRPQARYPSADALIVELCALAGLPAPIENEAVREGYLQAAAFVGRETELNTLLGALDEAADGRGSAWLVGGESGVGKSRLLNELRIRALVRGAIVLSGQAAQGGVPYQMWREPIKQMVIAGALRGLIGREQAAVFVPLLPELPALWAAALDDAPLPASSEMENDEWRRRGIASVLDVFTALSSATDLPFVLLLEDVQWAEEGLITLQVLSALAESLKGLIIASYRDDDMPELPDKLPAAQVMRLERFTPRQIERLTASMLGAEGAAPMLRDLLERETEGNAFFLVEVMRALAEEAGGLRQLHGRASLPERVLAGGVQQIVRRRLNRVPEAARGLLRLAAVAGRALDPALLAAAVARSGLEIGYPRLDEWLTACVNLAVLEISDGGWRFAHDKLREALLADLSADEAALLNRQVAETLETLYPTRAGALAGVLARHWRAAGDAGRERVHIVGAAAQAFETQDFVQAVELYARAADLRADDSPVACAKIDLEWARSLFHVSEYADVKEKASRAERVFRDHGQDFELAEAITLVGEADMQLGDLETAERLFQETLVIRENLGDTRSIAWSLTNLGGVRFLANRNHEARDYWGRALELMETTGDLGSLSSALMNYGMILDVLGEGERAMPLLQRAISIQRSLRDRERLSHTLVNVGFLALDQGDLDAAQKCADEGLYLSKLVGDRQNQAYHLDLMGELAQKRGELERARKFYTDSAALRRGRQPRELSQTLLSLAEVLYTTGDEAAARAAVCEGLRLRESAPHVDVNGLLMVSARLLAQRGAPALAYRLLIHVRAHANPSYLEKKFDLGLEMTLLTELAGASFPESDTHTLIAETLAALEG